MRITPANYKPILQYHFQVIYSPLHNGESFIANAKATTLPTLNHSPILIDYGNTYMYVKGKSKWNEITMTFYSLSTPNTNKNFWEYIQKHQETKGGIDKFKEDYMGLIQIQLKNPDESLVGTWTLVNAFASEINLGNLDWSADDVVQPEITFIYDYAEYT